METFSQVSFRLFNQRLIVWRYVSLYAWCYFAWCYYYFFLSGIFFVFSLGVRLSFYRLALFRICTYIYCKNKCDHHICTYTVSMQSMHLCVCPSITFCFLKIFKSLLISSNLENVFMSTRQIFFFNKTVRARGQFY